MDVVGQVNRTTVPVTQQFDRFVINKTDYGKQYSHLYISRNRAMRSCLSSLITAKWGPEIKIAARIIDTERNPTDAKPSDMAIQEEEDSKDKDTVAIIGVLYKEMALRTNVLDEFKDGTGNTLKEVDFNKNITDPKDFLVLEDESGRAVLGGELILQNVHQFVSGVMMALQGYVDDSGVFIVQDYLTADGNHSNKPPTNQSSTTSGDSYVLLVSGLKIGETQPVTPASAASSMNSNNNNNNNMGSEDKENTFAYLQQAGVLPSEQNATKSHNELSIQMLFDYLSGRLDTMDATSMSKAASIVRVIVAGDSVDISPKDDDELLLNTEANGSIAPTELFGASKAKKEKDQQTRSYQICKKFDSYLAQGLGSVNIDLMPGYSDPTTHILPQQPMHTCLFPHSSRFDSLCLVTNPYALTVGECSIVGHSGQPIWDMLRQTSTHSVTPEGEHATHMDEEKTDGSNHDDDDALRCLESCLRWGHIAPTAPDTLSCYPYTDVDPFVFTGAQCPHILYSGNQTAFSTKLIQGENNRFTTRLINLPPFHKTSEVVLVNTRTLDVEVLCFDVDI